MAMPMPTMIAAATRSLLPPATTIGFDAANPHQLTLGPSTTWIVQNRATTPVVVSWLAPAESGPDKVQTTLEVSAVNNHIHPAHKDPQAILQPGEWKAIKNVRMGMLFNVRELLTTTGSDTDGGGGGGGTPGRILLRHRTGPITIRNTLGPRNLECPIRGDNGEGGLIDVEPVQPPEPDDPDEPKPPKVDKKRPDFDYNKRCNSVAKMFRSEVPCPIDLYYVGTDTDWNTPSGHAMPKAYMDVIKGTELDKSTPDDPSTAVQATSVGGHPANASTCQEVHSFHLGVNPATSNPEVPAGMFETWDSPVAYLFTYTSHKFVARLRHDKTLVDEISIERTVVGDCPRERRKVGIQSSSIATAAGVEVGNKDGGEEEQDEVCKGKAACEDLLVKTSVNATSTSASTNVNATELTPAPAVADKIKNAGIENNADKVCTATDSDSATCNSGVKASVPQASSGVKVGSPVP
mmetsp:Transcript_25503/g.56703  ORF Transcript_25503/g.56703 Transcript_25503/m.56703 type:complete len:464 (+) Transcript_25503:146-1537(+)